ncbi:16S rRNA (adenine(1518)-N(6)/adenine(1519)-N(6))-dimethyltransferase RsmA [Candidatus Blochmannia ocreatus (nom. nud.)]|uniref:Ribosomal RNA small subunit methyltransferase A n=1 Tax=Candidatus Blochmannia ocreatus (nom. nud.) TaxID=251538 RepID=A0ABY4SUW7_9ENTR|nr:16S rRNA (adenine(1518)-N(6)/adenine(1519)-N(6))-dimethyltransferase RsmA [Candidatus Blochmannia ocreatus]URJ25209.1 16S rRNA (adenine(1518)-N(6)/adenine(1519)-N(6))-dimethyltransferase RsmA [Candidatus Blochmannia ocreatus]
MKKLYYKNHFIQKKWGQVFLKDQNIINDILTNFAPKKNQKIVEIGPGLGALTKKLLQITSDINSLIVIECDLNLVKQLNQIFNKKLNIYHQDVMNINFIDLSLRMGKKLRLIGNLPYNISTKLIIYLFQYIHVINDMYFTMQKEVADRILAAPNSKAYGRLSVLTQYYCVNTPIINIPKSSFFPIPQVRSTFIKLIPHHIIPYPKINIAHLSLITKLAFGQRRKILRNSLSEIFRSNEMLKQGINPKLRAENITINQYCTLTSMLNDKLKILKNSF